MSHCCEETPPPAASKKAAFTIALAGNPNSGKTTIFNALTGLRQKVANYPGVTVEKKVGRCKLPDGRWADVIDLPGTYSLVSRSPDEQIAMEVLRGIRTDVQMPDMVIVVVDASNLQRNLYLVSQLIELGRPMVVALSMMDVARRRGIHVSAEALQLQLDVPVIPIVGHKRQGINELKASILESRVAPLPNFPLPDAMREELLVVGGGLAILDSSDSSTKIAPLPNSGPIAPNEIKGVTRSWICQEDGVRRIDRFQSLAERLLIGDRAPDIDKIATREPVSSLLQGATDRLAQLGIDPMQADVEAHYIWIETVAGSTAATLDELAAMGASAPPVLEYEAKKQHLTDKIDAIFMHKIWGFVVFGVIMAALFVSIFWLADPIMGAVQDAVSGLGDLITPRLAEGPLRDLWTDGIVAGVGAVIVFVPQIAILFMFLAILEDSGYLVRAAFLMDRALARVGLHGKSFIPLLSSFACAIPGIMATRTIENRKDRLATIFIAPFMSCSARLPVYTLLIGSFFAAYNPAVRGGIMLSCYALGIVAAVGTAFLFKRTFLKSGPSAFILELPSYKLPQFTQVVRTVYVNTAEFLKKAGTTIFCLSVLLWALTYYGASKTEIQRLKDSGAEQKVVDAYQMNHSFAGRFGHLIEPAIKPLGYDWKMGVGLVGAFAAREVFVSTMGIVYSVGKVEDETTDLSNVMQADQYPDGRPVWTPLVAISLLAWFVLAMQCMSTLAIVRRETGGWKWPIAMLVYMNVLAYVVSLAIYQIGRIWFA
ncbi:MAG TPA: ferrous iron transport protein B [Tepidisphaeraceae bacterium]|nr:ferrous iron transport protein B [Tepidisphaeraceae bacterium]